jgi:hypothetical protein
MAKKKTNGETLNKSAQASVLDETQVQKEVNDRPSVRRGGES